MTTNNTVNITSAGIPVYDGAGSFTAIAIPVNVASGGQGNSSLTAFAVLCGGNSTTNPVQPVASVGSANQVLTSNGASALPSFQDLSVPSGTYAVSWHSSFSSVVDSTTYLGYLKGGIDNETWQAGKKFIVPKSGTITKAYGVVTVTGTKATSENVSIYILLNGSTDVTITTTSQWTATNNTFSNASMSQAVVAGDYLEFKIVTPAFSTNPISVSTTVTVYIT